MASSPVVLGALRLAGLSTPAVLRAQEAKQVKTAEFTGDLGLDNTPTTTPTKTFKKTDRMFTTGIRVTY